MKIASKWGEIEIIDEEIDYIHEYIENINFTIDKVYKVSIILLEIRLKTLILLKNC
jgi:hypothetical protein